MNDSSGAGECTTEHTTRGKKNLLFFRGIGLVLIVFSLLFGFFGWNFLRSEMHFLGGRHLVDKRRFKAAEIALAKAEKLVPHSPQLTYWQAVCMWHLGKTSQCVSLLNELVATRSWDSRTYYLLGEGYRSLKRPDLAESAFRKSHELEPSGRIAIALANTLFNQEKDQDARQVLEEQLAREVYSPVLHLYLKSQREAGNASGARNFLRRLRRELAPNLRNKSRAELARWDAELSILLGDPVGAIMAYHEALIIDKENFELWNDLALAFKLADRPKRADKAFARASRINADHYAPLINRLELALEQGNISLAKELAVNLQNIPLPLQVQERADQIIRAIENAEKKKTPKEVR
jgi:predicted Zn-dependent protease